MAGMGDAGGCAIGLFVKIRLLDGRSAQQSRHGRGDAAHLIVVPNFGRRLSAVYFCDISFRSLSLFG